jgi:hypothetical protein
MYQGRGAVGGGGRVFITNGKHFPFAPGAKDQIRYM